MLTIAVSGIGYRRWFGLERRPPPPIKQEYFLISLDPAEVPEGITETELALKLYSKLSSVSPKESDNQNTGTEIKIKDAPQLQLNFFQKVGKGLSNFISEKFSSVKQKFGDKK